MTKKTKKRLIPFGWLPAHWGMAGKMREVAQAEYDLSGEALERRLLAINIGERAEDDIAIATLNLDAKYGEVSADDLAKGIATIKNEPWVTIKKLETDTDNLCYGGVELDWNDAFVQNLEKHGYGPSPDQDDVVNEWFNDLCRNIALDAFDGVGDLSERIVSETNQRTGMHEDAIVLAPKKDKKDQEAED